MKKHVLSFLFACVLLPMHQADAAGDDLEPEDPIASIDGKPVFFGELNLVLTITGDGLTAIVDDVWRATTFGGAATSGEVAGGERWTGSKPC